MRVIAEAGLSLEIEPSMRLISEPEAQEFWAELRGALDRMESSWFSRNMPSEYAETVENLFASQEVIDVLNNRTPEATAGFARDFAESLCDFGYSPESIASWIEHPDNSVPEEIVSFVEAELKRLADVLYRGFGIDPCDGWGNSKTVINITALRDKWYSSYPENFAQYREFCKDADERLYRAGGKLSKAMAEEMSMTLSDWRGEFKKVGPFIGLVEDGWNESEKLLRQTLIRIAHVCWLKWEAFKNSRGGMSFSDMIALAAGALENAPEYAGRFKEVLVDEFQDTNEQQERLIATVRNSGGARLFIVGDLKQSIYRFRHAEPALFERYIREAENGAGRYIALSVSFRSSEGVLDAVNTRFGELWKKGLGDKLRVPYEPLCSPRGIGRAESWIEERQKTGLPVCERMFEDYLRDEKGAVDKDRDSTALARRRLARRLAHRLLELHRAGAGVWDGGEIRPVKWGDIAVLMPTRSSYGYIRDAFLAAGIPMVFSGSKSFYKRTEILDVCSLIRFLADPCDGAALAGFLCSPFSGVALSEAQKLIGRLATEDPLTVLDDNYPETAASLRRLINAASVGAPSEVLAEILTRADRLKSVHPRKRGGAYANLRRAVSVVEEYERSIGASVVSVGAYLRTALQKGIDDSEAVSEDIDDVVQVMTIHGSKGLEFPLVCLFGLEHGERARNASYYPMPDRRLMAVESNLPECWESGDPCRLARVQRKLDEEGEYEESQRLYYVGMTRARDGLILCGLMPQKLEGNSVDRSLRGMEQSVGEISPCGYQEFTFDDTGSSGDVESDFGDVLPLITARPRYLKSISATSYALWSMCPAAWRLKYRQNIELGWNVGKSSSGAGDSPRTESAGGTVLGSVIHELLSKWDFTPEGRERLARLEEGHFAPEYRCVLRSAPSVRDLKHFFDSFETPEGAKLLARFQKADAEGTLKREFPFKVNLGKTDLVGAVDVMWLESFNGVPQLCICDYKTTRIPQNDLKQRWMDEYYAAQLRFYLFALRRAYPSLALVPPEAMLWNLRTATLRLPDALTPSIEEQIEKQLAAQSEQAALGPWKAETGRCSGCPYYKSCIYR